MYSTLQKVWAMLKPFHHQFRVFVLFMILFEGLQIAETYVLGAVLTFHSKEVSWQTWAILLATMLLYDEMFMRLDNIIDKRIIDIHINQTYQHLKNIALKKFFDLSLGWHQDTNSAAQVDKVNRGVGKVHELISSLSWEVVPGIIQLLLSLIPLLFISPWIAVILLFSLSSFMYITAHGYHKIKPLREYRHDLYEEESRAFVSDIRAISTVRFSGQESKFISDFEDIHSGIVNTAGKELKILVFVIFRNRIRVLTLTRRVVLTILVMQLLNGVISVALLVYAYTLSEKLITSFWRFARVFDQASQASESAQRLSDLLEEKTDIPDLGTIVQSDEPCDIDFKSVAFGYQDNALTVNNLSFTIPEGTFVAIVGSSGAGKSTVISLVMRLYDVLGGEIIFAGHNVKDWKMSALRDKIAIVPQEPDIFDTTIMDNLTFGSLDITDEEVYEACKKAYIHDKIMQFPDGYNTKVGEDGQRLSGGEKQRLAIARALLKKSAVVYLFDEPTSALDSKIEDHVEEAMRSIKKTRIVIAHRLATVKHADLILVLDNGRVAEQGTHTELLANGGLYANLASKQNLE